MNVSFLYVPMKRKEANLQAQRILPNLTISARVRSVCCVQDRGPRSIQSKDIEVDALVSATWHRSVRVVGRIESGRDCIFHVSIAARDGDGIVGYEQRGNV